MYILQESRKIIRGIIRSKRFIVRAGTREGQVVDETENLMGYVRRYDETVIRNE